MGIMADKYLTKNNNSVQSEGIIENIIEQLNDSVILNIDDSKIKRIKSDIYIAKYLIEYEYETVRKNKKTQKRTIIQTSKEKAEAYFWIWVHGTNEKDPVRRISNVKILEINDIGGETIEL